MADCPFPHRDGTGGCRECYIDFLLARAVRAEHETWDLRAEVARLRMELAACRPH